MSDKELIEIIKNSVTRKEVLVKIGKSPRGGNYITLNRFIDKHDIDITHFHQGNKNSTPIPLEDILKEDVSYSSSRLKQRLFNEGLLQNECSICGQEPFWNGKKLVHTLDHINGDHNDNRIENLRIVCRHCDSQLDTFGARNRKDLIEKKFCKCGNELHNTNKGGKCQVCISKSAIDRNDDTCECGSTKKAYSKLCIKCSNKINASKQKRKVERPPYEQLLIEIEETSYSAVGRKYGVSDNAIRKWIRQYEENMVL